MCSGDGRCRGDGVALLAGGAVGDIAHRIDRLVRRTGGDQHAPAGKRARRSELLFHRRDNLQRLGHAAKPAFAGLRHLAFIGAGESDAIGDELGEIALRCLVGPHQRVHGGSQQDFSARRQQDRGGKIVGMAVRHLRHQVGGGRRNHHKIAFAGETDMTDVELAGRVEQLGEGGFAKQCAGRQRRDEMRCRPGEDAAHGKAALLQPADKVERFVGGDAAADDQQHALGAGSGRRPARASACSLRRRDAFGDVAAGLIRGLAQDGANLVLDRTAAARRAQAQFLLQRLVELTDGDAGHAASCRAIDCNAINAIK